MTGGSLVREGLFKRSWAGFIVSILSVSSLIVVAGQASAEVKPVRDPVKDSYIVTLKDTSRAEVPERARALSRQYGGTLRFVYQDALRGFSVTMPAQQAEALSRNPRVALVEEDGQARAVTTETNPPMGLDRIDRRDLPLNQSYDYYRTGAGVTAYIIDTGIIPTHVDFGGRARVGYDAIGDGRNGIDCAGHGTHVAGTVGGATYGVAKAVSLVAVRVLNCQGSGTWSQVIAGVDWVTANRVLPAVANMSLSGGGSSSVDQAVANSVASGVTYAVAAGNGDNAGVAQDACNYSPARAPGALTVSATDSTDTKASWANYGSCVDLFGPGVGIKSDWYSSDTATNTLSGTSMATPHVVGVAAQYLEDNPSATPQAVGDAIVGNSSPDRVQSAGTGSPNKLLYSAFIPIQGNQAPIASFTYSCSGLTCNFTDTSTDPDGSVASQSWNFGDSATATGPTVTHTYSAGGSYLVTLTVTDNASSPLSSATSKSVAVSDPADPDPSTPTLVNGVAVSTVSGAKNSWQYYKIAVPAGKTLLKTDLAGSTPDLDLYVRKDSRPTSTRYSCRSRSSSSNESCSVSNPAAAWWYVGVRVYSGSGLPYSVTSTYTP